MTGIRQALLVAAAASALLVSAGGAHAAAQSKLVVTVGGSGTGVVTSGDGNISCPAKSCSAVYDQGTLVDLTATPAKGTTFQSWTGAAASCGAKVTCTVKVSADPTTVAATFAPGPGPGHTLPRPFVQIVAPQPNVFLDLPSVTATGTVEVSTIPFRFCVVVNDRTQPDVCNGYAQVRQSSYPFTFSVPVGAVEGLHPGFNTITAWVYEGDGQVASWFVNVEVATPTNGIDLRTVTLEVTQGTQFWNLPFPPMSTSSSSAREAAYNGVRLARGGKTVVRVYADAISTGRPGHRLTSVRMLLYGYATSGHRALTGGPLLPIASPPSLGTGPSRTVAPAMRSHPRGAYTFDLPDAWTNEPSIELVAIVNPADLAPAIPECRDCAANNRFRLSNVVFTRADTYDIFPLRIWFYDNMGLPRRPPDDPSQVFADAATMTPAGEGGFRVHPWVAEIQVSLARLAADGNVLNGQIMGEVFNWQYHNLHSGFVVGVNTNLARGLTSPAILPLPIGASYLAITESTRPRTSVAHEFWHMNGTVHASTCTTGDPTAVAEPWPPDQRGYIEGYGLDRRGVAGADGPYRIMGEAPARTTYWYDFMSYCASESDSWISTRNWDRRLRGGGEQVTATAATLPSIAVGPTLAVTGLVETDGSLRLLSVGPGGSQLVSSEAPSPYTLTVRDGAGAVVSQVGVDARLLHIDHAPGQTRFFFAQVAAPDAATVELSAPGVTRAARTASAHAPTVTVLSPKAGARVGAGRTVVVGWRAADVDGGELVTSVDYSTDDGRAWMTLTVDAPGGSYAFPRALFSRSQRAPVRIRVSDGFHETAAVSGRFAAVGLPPVVHILGPAQGKRIPADANLDLAGQAFDDTSRLVPGVRLRWFLGKRLLATGATPSVTGFRPGRHTIRLEARDTTGRTGKATVRVRVNPVTPALLGFRPPKHLSPAAKRLTLRIASTVDATLRVGGKAVLVGRKARTVVLPVKPGRSALVLRLRVTSGGRAALVVVRIAR